METYYCSWSEDVQNFRFFRKKRCFFFERTREKFQKHQRPILSFRILSKSYYCLCKLQTFKTWAFLKNNDVFCGKILEKFQEQYLAFLNEIACQTFILLRNSPNNQIFGFFGEKMLFLKGFFLAKSVLHFSSSLRFK